ncbi:MAG TPA: hypothetical protein PLG59_00605 [bacterium]|mgnify:CR=1 FL=1|nr:hypothetical protein [bacterium]
MADVLIDFAALLNSIQPIAQAVAGRIYPAWNRDRGKDTPTILYEKIAVDRDEPLGMGGRGGLANYTIALEVLGKSYRQAREVAEKVRINLDCKSETVGDTEFQLIRIIGESDEFIEETNIYKTTFDLEVWASESAPVAVA